MPIFERKLRAIPGRCASTPATKSSACSIAGKYRGVSYQAFVLSELMQKAPELMQALPYTGGLGVLLRDRGQRHDAERAFEAALAAARNAVQQIRTGERCAPWFRWPASLRNRSDRLSAAASSERSG